MNHSPSREQGFALMTALFVVVVLGMLATFMLRLSVLQQTTVGYSLQGERAYYAATTGLNWGVYQALGPVPSCKNPYNPLPVQTVVGSGVGMTVTVSCKLEGMYNETGNPIDGYRVYRITATAEYGGYGSPDYIQRTVESVVTDAP